VVNLYTKHYSSESWEKTMFFQEQVTDFSGMSRYHEKQELQ